jgi:hypothetical protein
MSREAALLQGQNGGQVINSSSGAVTGTFRWVQIVNDAVFSVVTDATMTDVSNLQTITHLAGTGFGGNITALTVTSGVVIAYTQ